MTDLVAVTQTARRSTSSWSGHINFSSAGVGSGTHFAAEILKSRAAIDVVHVPFKGIPEALTDTMIGRVHFFMAPIANALAAVKDGRLTASASHRWSEMLCCRKCRR